mgnify:CR=1 FL=1
MGESKVNKNAKTIEIKSSSKKEFFLIHGYTGSPTDFNKLGKYLNKRFNANIKIIRLKGHGEEIKNIDKLTYEDFLLQSEKELKKEIRKGRQIIIGGISLGSFIALQLSAKYNLKGVICISLPYKTTFFAGIITFLEPIILKKHWRKPISDYEKELSKDAFYYDINIKGLKIVKNGKRIIKRYLHKVTSPCLIIHVEKDKVFTKESAFIINQRIKSENKKILMFDEEGNVNHNPFYSKNHEYLYKIIGDFVDKNKLFKNK